VVLTAARVLVAPPVRTPLPYGLLSAAQMPSDSDSHWQNGVQYQPDSCEPAKITTTDCPTPPADKLPTMPMGIQAANPFTVYTMPLCSPIGYIDEARTRAVAALTSGEARAVEREFWTGEFGTLPNLTVTGAAVTGLDGAIEQCASTTVSGSPVSPVVGLALLEEALSACYGNEGVIHITPAVLTFLRTNGSITVDGARLRSPNGHLVAAGAGYPGTGPDDVLTPGVRWAYATGAVFVRRSEIMVPTARPSDIVSRTKNDVLLVAERTYVIGWDCCCLFAIPISVG
jgi:hypothetical protein